MGRLPDVRPVCAADGNNLAYVIYTSGSTGKPKGTLLQHSGLVNLIHSMPAGYQVHPGSCVVQFACQAFDASVAEIFSTLVSGATLVLAPQETLASIADLVSLLQEGMLSRRPSLHAWRFWNRQICLN